MGRLIRVWSWLLSVLLAVSPVAAGPATAGKADLVNAPGAPGKPQDEGRIPSLLQPWLTRAGSICREISPRLLAAQIDTESRWDPHARAHNSGWHGGDAMGLAQFQEPTWRRWGRDFDNDGINSPFDPQDAIMAAASLMCGLVKWARGEILRGDLRGDALDVALAAYNCGQGCVLAAGGVPPYGQPAEYPQKVRERAKRR